MAFNNTAVPATSTDVTMVAVSVKNTFIDGFYEEELARSVAPVRRCCSSLPPSLRLVHGKGLRCLNKPLCSTPVPFPNGITVDKSSTGDDDASTDIGTFEGDDASSRSEMGASEVDDTSMETEATFPKASVPVQGPLVHKTRLNPQARVWKPCTASWSRPAPALTVPKGPTNDINNFGLQLRTVVGAARMALLSCAHVATVEAENSPAAWSIVVRIPPKDARFREAALTVAKQALLDAAERSQHVYVYGYRHRPFVVTPAGFTANLGYVPDDKAACWGLMEQGFCKFGPCCQWQHPELQTTVTVTVVLEDVKQE